MADTTPDSSEQPDNAGAPTEAPTGTTQSTDPQPPTQPETGADEGKGSKDAVLADLARERDKRHQLAEQLTQAQAETKAAQLQLAVYQSMPDGVDREALLDSTTFQKAIADVPADKVAETVASFVESNPRFLRTNPGAGASDAGAGNPPTAAKSMDDWLRGK